MRFDGNAPRACHRRLAFAVYACWAADHARSNELFISGIPIDGMAGMMK